MVHKVDKIQGWHKENKTAEHKQAKQSKLTKFKEEIAVKINKSDLNEDFKRMVIKNIKYRMTTIFDDSLFGGFS